MGHNKILLTLLTTALLSACGGGGGASTSIETPDVTPTPVAISISGTGALGAPFDGATVTIFDRNGEVGSDTVRSDGAYSVTLIAGAVAPFVIQAVRDDQTLISVVSELTDATTANITPITNLIAARLSPSGDPAKLVTEMQAAPELLTPTKVSAKVIEVVAVLQPLLDAVETTVNPLTGQFNTDGTGMDRVLDSLSITITPESTQKTNIEVAIKQLVDEAAAQQPDVVAFSSSDETVPQLASITKENLLPSGAAPLIADLMVRASACYALPVAQRVETAEATNASPSDIIAPACRSLFNNSDPAEFLNNGQRITGATRSAPFNGIFRAGATNVVLDRGTYEFTRPNGDLVIGYRSTDSIGGVQNHTSVVRLSLTDNRLYFVGNQYEFAGGVTAYHQLRTFINQPAATYYSTGYAFNVPTNNALARVVITTPKGGTLTLRNNSASAAMRLVKNGAVTGNSYLRVRGEYASGPESDDPSLADVTMFFDPSRPSNEVIAGFAHQSTWKFDYYLADNPSEVYATQTYKTRTRALTIPELRTQGFAVLNNDVINGIQAASHPTNGSYPLNFTGPAVLSWNVPAGALAPTDIRIFGRAYQGAPTFDDSVTVNSTARQASIFCSPQSDADVHCASAGGSSYNFVSGSYATGIDLTANEATGRGYSHFYAAYKVTLP